MTDLRLAVRMIAGRPGMSILAIVALALGIGLTTIMFSIVNGVILRGLPFADSDRLYHFERLNRAKSSNEADESATLHDYVDWSARQRSFEELTAYRSGGMNVVGRDGTPARYNGAWITTNTLHLLRVQPVLGRDFRVADGRVGAEPVAIIGDKIWQERFGRDPAVIGRSIRVNGTAMSVVGVMAPRFEFPETQQLWLPEILDTAPATRAKSVAVEVVGRLPAGASLDQAKAEMATIATQLEAEYPDTNKGIGVLVKPYMTELIPEEIWNTFAAMMVAVIGVLIIACANVTNLVLARAAERTREIAMRTALGASRFRVVRQMLVEVLLLSVIGAAIGFGIARIGTDLFMRAIVDTNPPFWIDVRIDRTVLVFVTAITVLATIVAGLVPALRASRAELAAIMNDEGRITPDFFDVLRVGIEGRSFDSRDGASGAPVAIVNRAFAAKYFPDGALGKQFAMLLGDHQEWRTIVGIAPDLSVRELVQGQVPETFFLPIGQAPPSSFAIAVRTAGPPLQVTSAVREAVRVIDPNMPVSNVNSLEQAMYDRAWPYRVFGSLFTAFGFAALFLATVGLYGVMAFSVSRRTQEVGVRMAMGARSRDVLTMILRQGFVQAVIGIVIGAGMGVGLGFAMSALLFNVSPYDVRVFVSVGVILTLTALAACLVPARRAAGLDPMVALRRQ